MNKLICTVCKQGFALEDEIWKCFCGGLLDINYDSSFPIKKISKRKPTIWRYREAIPILNNKNIITLNEGFTPIIPVEFSGKKILIKQEQLFSTGSFKDRGASVLVSKLKELRISKVVEDSSGNAGCAIAAYSARASIDCDIYVPSDTTVEKIAQIKSYGANIYKIPGSREETAKAVLSAAKTDYYASHSWNPFFLHGTKTFAFEVCEQLNWSAPDTVILPIGNGTLYLGAFIGFNELLKNRIIDTMPKLIGVQAANCAPLYNAFKDGSREVPPIKKQETIADGIAIAEPVRGKQILKAVKKSKGEILAVDEIEIKDSLVEITNMGYSIEPTAAATTAGINQYLENSESGSDEVIVSAFTGNGSNATEKIKKIISSS